MEQEQVNDKKKNVDNLSKKALKRKFADARGYKCIIESKYKNIRLNNEKFTGNISLLEIEKVEENWYVDEEKRCVLAKGYRWLGIYQENKNYCITAIFNEDKELVEWYIDIARKLGVEKEVPYEDDLYLDVVIVSDGRKHLLDEDELQEAYEKNIIDKQEYDMAYELANKILEVDENNIEKLRKFSYKYLEILENYNKNN